MINVCDAVFLLPDWKNSFGAKYEFGHAAAMEKRIVYMDECGSIVDALEYERQDDEQDTGEDNE